MKSFRLIDIAAKHDRRIVGRSVSDSLIEVVKTRAKITQEITRAVATAFFGKPESLLYWLACGGSFWETEVLIKATEAGPLRKCVKDYHGGSALQHMTVAVSENGEKDHSHASKLLDSWLCG